MVWNNWIGDWCAAEKFVHVDIRDIGDLWPIHHLNSSTEWLLIQPLLRPSTNPTFKRDWPSYMQIDRLMAAPDRAPVIWNGHVAQGIHRRTKITEASTEDRNKVTEHITSCCCVWTMATILLDSTFINCPGAIVRLVCHSGTGGHAIQRTNHTLVVSISISRSPSSRRWWHNIQDENAKKILNSQMWVLSWFQSTFWMKPTLTWYFSSFQ